MPARSMPVTRAVRVLALGLAVAAGGMALFCYVSYRQDQAVLREVALRETEGLTSPAERAIRLLSWVHRQRGFGKNKGYFLVRRLGPTPLQVLESGGDCADKSRLLGALLRELDIPSTPAMCFNESGQPTHTVVNAWLPDGSAMVLDPIWDLYFPREAPGEYYGLLDLRRDPQILWRRLEAVTASAEPTAHVHGYNRKEDVYDRASTFNWDKNALTGGLRGILNWWWPGEEIHLVPRPAVLEEPKLAVAAASSLLALFALALRWRTSRRMRRARAAGDTPALARVAA